MDFWGSGRGSGSHDYGYGDDDFGGAGEENEFLQDSEQAVGEWQELNRKDSLIYLVDCSELMSVKDDEGYSWLMKTIQTIIESVKTKIIVEPSDHVAVVFYNTRESQNGNGFPGIYVLFPSGELSAERIRLLANLRSPIDFEKQIGSARTRAQQTDLYRALWVCSDVFQAAAMGAGSKTAKNNFIKRIFLFTANDDPAYGRADLTALTVQKFADLNDLGIEIHLFPLDPGFLPGEESKSDAKSSLQSAAGVGQTGSTTASGSLTSGSSQTQQSLDLSNHVKREPVTAGISQSSLAGGHTSVKTELAPSDASGTPDYSTGIVGGFNLGKFYARVLLDEGDYISDFVYRIKDKMSNLLTSVRSKLFKKRSLGTLEFRLGNSPDAGRLGVKVYCNVREFRVEPPRRIDPATNELLTTETQWICPSTGAKLEAQDMKKFYPFAGQRIMITDEEMRQLKTFGEPKLMLLGFKDESAVKIQYNLKAPYFLFPDDRAYPGSNVSFVALVQSMAKLRKVAIARIIPRRNAIPRLIALLPQLERIDESTGAQIDPFGLHMVFLPYADEVRRLKLNYAPPAPVELIDKAKAAISQLTLPCKDRSWIGQTRNPVVQRHYDVLQAIALNLPLPSQIEDQLQPIPQLFNKPNATKALEEFYQGVEEVAGIDSAAPASTTSRRKKVDADVASGDNAAASSPADFSAWPIDKEFLKKKTLNELKDYLRSFKLPVSGTKDVLIERVFNHQSSSKQ